MSGAHLTWLDWSVVAAYLVISTFLGAILSFRQATFRDFFLGGRRLPWYAVSGSIVATEISAVTMVGVPAAVFAAGGDFTYLQIALSSIVARVIIAVWFVPAFYKHEIYSPYDYMAGYFGPSIRSLATTLFVVGAMLGQSVRLLLTAIVLETVSGVPLAVSIWVIGAVAILWTLLGGITTVVWTDVVQFVVLVGALLAALLFVVGDLPGGWGEMFSVVHAAGKLRVWDFSLRPTVEYAFWAALIGNTTLCLNAFGTDQMIAQRIFCCRGPAQARLAMIGSSVSVLVALLALLVGAGLFAFYQRFPMSPDAAARIGARADGVFPLFIIERMPPGLNGLVIAGIFAAASLNSVLAALAQTVISAFYRPWRQRRVDPAAPGEEHHYLLVSKVLVVGWGVALSAMANVALLARDHYPNILSLALAMATYTGGVLLAAFLLALWRVDVDGEGLLWAAPLSVFSVFAVTWHQPWARFTTTAAMAILLLAALARWGTRRTRSAASRAAAMLAGVCIPLMLAWITLPGDGPTPRYLAVAWPWNVPIGFVVALLFGVLLAGPRRAAASERRPVVVGAAAPGVAP
ncbi:MAG: Sodium/glucose cotransporter [Phycisphaerae bacterium]|nr:Sodium/glucose cotransporter [Phycisphaerae bacterium]